MNVKIVASNSSQRRHDDVLANPDIRRASVDMRASVMLVLFLADAAIASRHGQGEVQPWVFIVSGSAADGLICYQRLMLGNLGLGWLIAVVIASTGDQDPRTISRCAVWRGRSRVGCGGQHMSRLSPCTPCTGRRSDGNHRGIVRLAFDTHGYYSHSCDLRIVGPLFHGLPAPNPGRGMGRVTTFRNIRTPWRVAGGGVSCIQNRAEIPYKLGAAGAGRTRATQRTTTLCFADAAIALCMHRALWH